MSLPPTSSLLLISLFLPIFSVPAAAADRVCLIKIWRSELQGNAKAKLFYPEHSEINPAEMEMRHNERMNSRSARGGRQNAEGWGEGKGSGCYKSKNMFQPVETALSANWPDSNHPPHVLLLSPLLPWPTKENVNKLAIADRIKPFQRAQNNKANLSVPGTVLTRTVEREWHFRTGVAIY